MAILSGDVVATKAALATEVSTTKAFAISQGVIVASIIAEATVLGTELADQNKKIEKIEQAIDKLTDADPNNPVPLTSVQFKLPILAASGTIDNYETRFDGIDARIDGLSGSGISEARIAAIEDVNATQTTNIGWLS